MTNYGWTRIHINTFNMYQSHSRITTHKMQNRHIIFHKCMAFCVYILLLLSKYELTHISCRLLPENYLVPQFTMCTISDKLQDFSKINGSTCYIVLINHDTFMYTYAGHCLYWLLSVLATFQHEKLQKLPVTLRRI